MSREYVRYRAFTRRAALLAGGKVALLSALVGRLYYLQVAQSDRYAMLADENRISLRLLAPPRGHIVDRYGNPLAVNRLNYRVVIVAEQTPNVAETLDIFARIVSLGDRDRRRVLREVSRKKSFLPVTIRENLTWKEVARIEVNAPDLPGVTIDVGQSRDYPLANTAAHVVGYVAAVTKRELTGDPLLEIPGFRIGKSGVEKTYDLPLRGRAGTSQVEVNAIGRVIRELDRDEGQPGREVTLTLDRELQTFATRRLEGESGAVVLMDAHTGAVLALASTPSFDPNAFNMGLSQAYWHELITNPRGPLTNKTVAGQYPPGSTFKMMVALAGLESGIVNQYYRVFCTGRLRLGDTVFHGWKRSGHGSLNMVGAITQSCDIYFYELARRVGVDRIAEMAARFGLGRRLGLDLPNERSGLIPTRAWKQATLGMPWQKGETLVTGIGQGYVLTTPLQLAVMVARLVNGGFAVIPHIARDIVDENGVHPRPKPDFAPIGVSAASLAVTIRGMNAVTNSSRGTAFRARIRDPGLEMGGKTGTAQVRRITRSERRAGVRKNKDRPWIERDHALFVGYAPISAPRYVISVIVEHGGGGSKTAAPIARDILTETQRRNPVGMPLVGQPGATPQASRGGLTIPAKKITRG